MQNYVTIVLALMAAVILLNWLIRRRMSYRLYLAVVNKDLAGCLRILDNPLFRMVFSGYEYLSLRISAAAGLRSADMLEECLQRLKSVVMKKEQRESVLFRLASCYVDWGEREKVEMLMEELKASGSGQSLAIIDRLYHIYIRKDDLYLPEMEEEFKTVQDPDRKRELAAYLTEQYENRGDSAQARRYLEYIKANGKEAKKC